MVCAHAHFGRAPVEALFAIAGVAQRGRRDQHAVRGLQHGFGKWNGRIDPVALEPDVEVASVVSLDLEPIGEFGGCALLVFERSEHRAPRRNEEPRPPFDAASGGFEPHGETLVELGRLTAEPAAQRAGHADERADEPRQSMIERTGGGDHLGRKIDRFGLAAVGGIGLAASRAHIRVGCGEERFARTARRAALDAREPALRRQHARRRERFLERIDAFDIVAEQLADALVQSARPRPPALGTAQPAAQFRHLGAREMRAEGGVRRVEHMMAFVEHETQAAVGRDVVRIGVADAVLRRMRHDERVVGDHHRRVARAPEALLDEAGPVMRTGGIDALAAPVGQLAHRNRRGEERGKLRARQVAVLRRRNPARDQCERDRALAGRERRAFHGVLEIQQAEIILAAFAQDHVLVALLRIGIELRRLLKDLALQIARVGGDPEAGSVALRPQRGRREIAERLSRARSRFDKSDARRARAQARREGRHRCAGEFALLLSCAAVADDGGLQARLGAVLVDRVLARPSGGRFVFPLRETAPGIEARERCERAFRFAQHGENGWSPAPTGLHHLARGLAGAILLVRRELQQSIQQRAGGHMQHTRGILRSLRLLELQRAGKPERAWKARFARAARTRKARARHRALSRAARRSAR